MPKFHIDEVYPKDPRNPMIIHFQSGYATDAFKSRECSLFDDENTNRNCVAIELNDILYAGDEETEALGKTLVLARNKTTGKVRLIEVSNVDLKPVIRVDDEAAQLLETSNLELSRKFGSKKQRQQIEQREKLKVNVDTVTQQMENVTQNISEDKLDLSSYNKGDSDDYYIPPIDRNATTVEDVYDINKILTEDEYEKIYSELEEKDYKSELHPFIQYIVLSRKTLPFKLTVLAVYASELLKLYSLMVKDNMTRKQFVLCSLSPTLNEIILNNFTSVLNNKRTRSTPAKDKALCYAMVFALLINNCSFDMNTICENLKLTPSKVSNKVRVTGATVVNSGGKKTVQLKLPLNNKGLYRRKSAKF